MDWLKKGEACTKFFHTSVIAKRAKRKISQLCDDYGQWVNEES